MKTKKVMEVDMTKASARNIFVGGTAPFYLPVGNEVELFEAAYESGMAVMVFPQIKEVKK
jgi:hypothetical protein